MTGSAERDQDLEEDYYEEPKAPLPPELSVSKYLDDVLGTNRDPLLLSDFILLGTFYRWAVGQNEREAPAGAAHYENFYDLEALRDLLPPSGTKRQIEGTVARFEHATQSLMVNRSTRPHDPKREFIVELIRGEVIVASNLYAQYADFTPHGHVIGRIALICAELFEMRAPGQEHGLGNLMELIQIQNRSAFDYYELRMEAEQGLQDRAKSIEEKHERRRARALARSPLPRLAKLSRNQDWRDA